MHEGGQSVAISSASAHPISWVGSGRNAPMVSLAGLALDAPGGAWIVSTTDMTLALGNATDQTTSAPHVWVSGDDLRLMAAACGIAVSYREPQLPPPMSSRKTVMMILGISAIVGLFVTLAIIVGPNKKRSTESCDRQRSPEVELYPRLSCQDARAELDRVARGKASPRLIVLRANSMTVDARDTTGPGKIICDGIEFAVIDALQAADEPIMLGAGPHSVLVAERADGTLQVSQYCICCNVVRGERRGPQP